MVPDLTLEVIYYNQPTDFKMEFKLCGSCNVRFLSATVKNRSDFLSSLGKSVIRSRVVIALGSFNSMDSEYLPKIISKATGYPLKPVDKELYKISTPGEILLPEKSMPLIDAFGNIAGCLLESNDQAIILLTSNRELRHEVVSELVCPYLKEFSRKELGSTVVANPFDGNQEQEADSEPEQLEEISSHSESGEDIQPEAVEKQTEVSQESLPEEANNNSETISSGDDASDKPASTSTENQKTEEQNEHDSQEKENPLYTILEQPQTEDKIFGLQELLVDNNEKFKFSSRGNKPRRGIFKILISIILAIAVLLCSYFGYEWVFQPMQKNMVYNNMRELYGQTWSNLPENMLYKFGRLYQTNPDVYGWIKIPETSINHPVVSTQNKSSSYYENHLFEGSVNRYGTLYTNATLNGALVRNTVIYGKDVENGQMLSDIKKYLDIDHYRKAPTFSFDTVFLEGRWKIFSIFNVSDAKRENYTKTYFFDDNDYLEYLNLLKQVSLLNTAIDVEVNDQIITLALSTEGKDVFVVARKVREGESPLVDITSSEIKDNIQNSSDIPVIADNPGIVEVSSSTIDSSQDSNMADGASSRYEQQAPVSSTIIVKPSKPKPVSSRPPVSSIFSSKIPSSNSAVTSKPVSSKPISSTVTSKIPVSSSTSSAPPQVKLPTLTVKNTFNGKKVSGPANEIIAQILEAEMSSGYELEALKAQAVAAYSWLLCNGSANGGYPDAPMRSAGARCIQAANAVAGEVAVSGDKVAQTYYYAISAGRTANSQDIWVSKIPYLVSVDSSVDKSVNGYQTIRKYAASDVATWAKASLNVDLETISNKNNWFTSTYDANGIYVKTVKIGTVTKKGTYLRDSFFTAARVGASNVLRSSAYTISYNQSDDKFVFTVKGYGHGVGMSQTGANAYAKKGWDYEKILKHYYTGISLGTYYAD